MLFMSSSGNECYQHVPITKAKLPDRTVVFNLWVTWGDISNILNISYFHYDS